MDEVLIGAVEVLSDTSDIKPFFTIVKDTYDEHNSDFDDFKTALLADTNGYAEQRQALVEYADNNQQLDLIKQLSDLGPDQLISDYEAYLDEAETAEGEESEEDDALRQEFVAYLTEYSAYWDGTEENWDEFLGTVQDYALDTFPGPAQEFFDRATSEDKLALFAEYGITIGGAEDAGGGAEAAERDPDEVWAELVAECGDWSGWDGSDEGWEQWRDWLYGEAATRGGAVGDSLAHQQLGWMDGLSLSERIAGLEERGFTVTGATAALEAKQQEAQAAVDELVEKNIDVVVNDALAALNINPALAGDLKPLLQERLETMATSQPEVFAGLTAQDLQNQLQEELETELRAAMENAS